MSHPVREWPAQEDFSKGFSKRNCESQRYPDVCDCQSFNSEVRLGAYGIALPSAADTDVTVCDPVYTATIAVHFVKSQLKFSTEGSVIMLDN
jgi:hypothetical protein